MVLGPTGGVNVSPGDPDQVTGPPAVEKKAVQPTQLCEGPFIFNTGLMVTFLTVVPLQFFLSGLLYVQVICPVGPAPQLTVITDVFTLGPTIVPPITVQL